MATSRPSASLRNAESRSLCRAIVPHALQELGRERIGQLVPRGAAPPHPVQVGQRICEAHALEVGTVAKLPLARRRDTRSQSIAHQRTHEGAPGRVDVIVDTDSDVLRQLHLGRIAARPRRAPR